jgi:phospholipase/carboxylesterase
VRRERERGVDSERIVVAGFSQGGAIAVQLALRFPEQLAGLVALSTYPLLEHRLAAEAHEVNRGLPAFVGHGTHDPMVPSQLGERLAKCLRGIGCPVEWHGYAMPHAVCPEEVADLAAWLRSRLT